MKIGLISDIHANYPALIKALKIFNDVGVNKILCAGDLVEKGEDGDAVVELIQKLKIPSVLGNHDEMAPENQQWLLNNMDLSHPKAQKALLKPESLDYLGGLPRNLRFEWEGLRVLLVHGSPASNIEYLNPKTPRDRFVQHSKIADADIIICGHTHRPMHYLVNGVHFINPGSVKPGNYISSHTCAVLTLPQKLLVLYHLEGNHQETLPPYIPIN